MKLVLFITGIVLLTVSLGYYYNYNTTFDLNVFQYRAVRIAYKNFLDLMDSLFNEFRDEDDEEGEQTFLSSFFGEEEGEEIVVEEEIIEENHPPACYTWETLNELLALYFQQIKNASILVREMPKKIDPKLYSEVENIMLTVRNFDVRLSTMIERTPRYLFTAKAMVSSIQSNLREIQDVFASTVLKAIERIDADQIATQKMVIVRWAKILRQFEKVIESQNDAHLDCTCDVARKLYEHLSSLEDAMQTCGNDARTQLRSYIAESSILLSINLEMAMMILTESISSRKKYSSVDAFFELPKRVCIFLFFLNQNVRGLYNQMLFRIAFS